MTMKFFCKTDFDMKEIQKEEAGDESRELSYSKAVMLAAGISNLEKANIFLPRSFREAPI